MQENTMTHNEIQQNLEAFYDGDLAGEQRREVERHLAGCSACAGEVERLRTISRAVFRPVPVPNTDFFVSRVMAGIREIGPVEAGGFWRWPALALLAMALFLIMTAPSERISPDRRAPSTRTVLLADAGPAAQMSPSEELDSLLDLTSEDI
jgi:anti-sigma factor RsiW